MISLPHPEFVQTFPPKLSNQMDTIDWTPTVNGGLRPLTFELLGDHLPPGIEFSRDTGRIFGTVPCDLPDPEGYGPYWIVVRDARGFPDALGPFWLREPRFRKVPSPPPPAVSTVSLAALSASVAEGQSLSGTLSISPAFGSPTVVTLAVTGVTPNPVTPGSDLPGSVNVTVPAGVVSHDFTIATVDDPDEEPDENGRVTIQPGAGYVVGSPASLDFTIQASDRFPPENVVAPSISGTAQVGQQLTCSPGTWTGTAPITFSYQWRRNGTAISGATASTYTLVAADEGATIRCSVTATNVVGSATAESNNVGPVQGAGTNPNPQNISASIVETLSGDGGVEMQWLRIEMDGTVSTARLANGPSNGQPQQTHPTYPQRITATIQSSGYTRQGGQCVPTVWTRTAVSTGPRLERWFASQGPSPGPRALEEDLGGGRIRLWLALSQWVYQGDQITISGPAGWRTGADAFSNVAVNTSGVTLTPPIPNVRRMTLPHEVVTDTRDVRLDWAIASHTPRNFGGLPNQAIAGMEVIASDGTNTNTVWVLEDSESTQYGDSRHYWGLMARQSGLLTGLANGPISVRVRVYPWIGQPVLYGPLAHSSAIDEPFSTSIDSRQIVHWRGAETGSLAPRFARVAPGGATTASAGLIYNSEADARTGTACGNINCAIESARLAGIDFGRLRIMVSAGTVPIQGTTANSGGTQNGPVIIYGDPENANPRANCIVDSTSSTSIGQSSAAVLFRFENLTLRRNGGAPMGSSSRRVVLDRVTVHNLDTSSNNFFASAPPDGIGGYVAANSSATVATGANSLFRATANNYPLFFRNCVSAQQIGCVWASDCVVQPISGLACFQLWSSAGYQALWHCRAERAFDAAFVQQASGSRAPSATNEHWIGLALIGNLYERRQSGWNVRALRAEDYRTTGWIIEGNTIWGGGNNIFYNGSNGETGTTAAGAALWHRQHRIVGNLFERFAYKPGDEPSNPASFPTLAEYERTHSIGYGVGTGVNVIANRLPASVDSNQWIFAPDVISVRPNTAAGVAVPGISLQDDRSHLSPNATSSDSPASNLRLLAGSHGKSVGWTGNHRQDVGGALRGTDSSVGAWRD